MNILSIRLKLLLSYIAMIIIPVLLLGSIALAVSKMLLNSEKEQNYESLRSKQTSVLGELIYVTANTPDKLNDKQYLNKLETRLSSAYSGIMIKKGNSIVYVSPILVQRENDSKDLNKGIEGLMYKGRKYDLEVLNENKFQYSNGPKGTVTLFNYKEPIPYYLQPSSITVVLLTIAITNLLLTYFVSKSIIRPLRLLKEAAEKIKDGDLEFKIESKSKDEFGELSRAFEEMRYRLKESIDQESLYEENRKDLLASISHDLKTPITSIKGYVEGIMDGVANTPEKQAKYIQTIYTKINDMNHLIDELLLFSKLDLKKLPFHFENVHLRNYLTDLNEELHFDLEKNNIHYLFHFEVDEDTYVIADREKLKRVISNIIENSVKYMKIKAAVQDDKIIELKVTDLGSEILFSISDNGMGMDRGTLPHIFDRFYRGEASRNSKNGGSGLGLSIVKQIIIEHGGSVMAESEAGKGTVVSFTLRKQRIQRGGIGDE